MRVSPLPPRELVQRLLRYDPDTGNLIWLPRPLGLFASEHAHAMWTTKFCGKVAGCRKSPYRKTKSGYVDIRIARKICKAHRLVWLHVRGEPVPDIIDHIDCDGLNNRIENLRATTNSLNRVNARIRVDNKLGIKGVYLMPHGRFTAIAGGKYLGTFKTADEAAAAYRDRAEELYGDFVRTHWHQK